MLEKTLQSKVLKYLNSIEGCIAENMQGNTFSRGKPDINACYMGRCIRIELKSPDNNNKPTKIQLENLQKWRKAGALAFWTNNIEDVEKVMMSLKSSHEGLI